jgi:hypothetical protein
LCDNYNAIIFTMTGLEIAAAVFGIIGGIASATKAIKDLRQLYLKRKSGTSSAARAISETMEQRLDRLEEQLKISELALEQQAHEISRLNRGGYGKSSVHSTTANQILLFLSTHSPRHGRGPSRRIPRM